MRIELIIADFEGSFTASFKHTSRVKYNVDFENSNIIEIEKKLNQLHNNITNNIANDVHIGYNFNLTDVAHIQALLQAILIHYKDTTGVNHINSNTKIYSLLNQLKNESKQLQLVELGNVKEMLSQLTESQNSIKEDTDFVKKIYTTPKEKKASNIKEPNTEKKAKLRHKILNPRG